MSRIVRGKHVRACSGVISSTYPRLAVARLTGPWMEGRMRGRDWFPPMQARGEVCASEMKAFFRDGWDHRERKDYRERLGDRER